MSTDVATESAAPTPVRWSPEQFQRMTAAGLLPEAAGHELVEGTVYRMSPLNPPHTTAVLQLEAELRELLPSGYHVRTQQPLTVGDSAPEPDLAVVRGRIRDFATAHPTNEDVALVVEVADASLPFDRTTKLALYAAAGIPAYWIVNLRDHRIEVHDNPTSTGEYASRATASGDGRVALLVNGEEVGAIASNSVIA